MPTQPEDPTELVPFSWSRDEPSILMKNQAPTAVYVTEHGEVVIRQKAEPDEEGDPMIVLDPINLERLILRLQEVQQEIDPDA